MSKSKNQAGQPRKAKPAFNFGKLSVQRDPRVYADRVPAVADRHKRCLGLDLATNCGAAFCDFVPGEPVKDATVVMGQWDLSLGAFDSGPLRHIRLKQFLAVTEPDLIVFEHVRHVGSNASYRGAANMTAIIARVASAAELIGGLATTLSTWAEERGVACQGFSVGTIKKFATGNGNAGKEAVIEAANEQFGTDFSTEDYEKTGVDNLCDAAFLCLMGVTYYSEGLTGDEQHDR